jgi:hypothetical protein
LTLESLSQPASENTKERMTHGKESLRKLEDLQQLRGFYNRAPNGCLH